MIYFILMYGVPASGKSTVARHIAEHKRLPDSGKILIDNDLPVVIISSDETRRRYYDDIQNAFNTGLDEEKERMVWNDIMGAIRDSIKSGINVILDATNLKRVNRLRLIALAKATDRYVRIVLVGCIATLETIKKRNKKRDLVVRDDIIEQMYFLTLDRKEIPSLNEGYNEMYYIITDEVV